MEADKSLIRFYTITSEMGNMIYTGSTGQTLQQRLKQHISGYKQRVKGAITSSGCTSHLLFDEYGVESCKISELSSKMCDKKER